MFGFGKSPSKEAVRDAIITIVRDEIRTNGPLIALLRNELVDAETQQERMARMRERHFERGGTIDTEGNSYGPSYVYVSGSASSGGPENDRVVIGVRHHAPKGEVWSPTSLRVEQVEDVIAALERARNHIAKARAETRPRCPAPTTLPDA